MDKETILTIIKLFNTQQQKIYNDEIKFKEEYYDSICELNETLNHLQSFIKTEIDKYELNTED